MHMCDGYPAFAELFDDSTNSTERRLGIDGRAWRFIRALLEAHEETEKDR